MGTHIMASYESKQPPKYAETNTDKLPNATESSILVEPTAPQPQQSNQTSFTFTIPKELGKVKNMLTSIVCLTFLGLLLAYMIYQPDMTCEEGKELVRSRWLSFHFECAPIEEVSWLSNLLRTIGLIAIGLVVVVVGCCCCCGEALSGCS